MTYTQAFSKLGRWLTGHRHFHDLVIHPLMALTGYADSVVKLHDYHAFTTVKPTEGLVGITGSSAAVERVFRKLGLSEEQIKHFHSDGLLCFGLVEDDPEPIHPCPVCSGRGQRQDWDGRWSRCWKCDGTGRYAPEQALSPSSTDTETKR